MYFFDGVSRSSVPIASAVVKPSSNFMLSTFETAKMVCSKTIASVVLIPLLSSQRPLRHKRSRLQPCFTDLPSQLPPPPLGAFFVLLKHGLPYDPRLKTATTMPSSFLLTLVLPGCCLPFQLRKP